MFWWHKKQSYKAQINTTPTYFADADMVARIADTVDRTFIAIAMLDTRLTVLEEKIEKALPHAAITEILEAHTADLAYIRQQTAVLPSVPPPGIARSQRLARSLLVAAITAVSFFASIAQFGVIPESQDRLDYVNSWISTNLWVPYVIHVVGSVCWLTPIFLMPLAFVYVVSILFDYMVSSQQIKAKLRQWRYWGGWLTAAGLFLTCVVFALCPDWILPVVRFFLIGSLLANVALILFVVFGWWYVGVNYAWLQQPQNGTLAIAGWFLTCFLLLGCSVLSVPIGTQAAITLDGLYSLGLPSMCLWGAAIPIFLILHWISTDLLTTTPPNWRNVLVIGRKKLAKLRKHNTIQKP